MENNLVFASEKGLKPKSEDRLYIKGYDPGSYDFIIVAYKSDKEGKLKDNSVFFNATLHISQ